MGWEMAETEKRPSEGDYVIYHYGLQDDADEGWALALYQMRDGRLRGVFHPGDLHLGDNQSTISGEDDKKLFEFLKETGIEQVYSIFHYEDFCGIRHGCLSMHEGEDPDEIELWQEWKPIYDGRDEHRELQDQGIEVLFYRAKQG